MDIFAEVEGYCVLANYVSVKEKILNMTVRDSDVWICTFPKSGTLWVQELSWLLVNNLDFERALGENIIARAPFLEFDQFGKPSPIVQENHCGMACTIEYVGVMKDPRVIKTHLPWELLPLQIQRYEKKPRIIWVTRNPKDVIVSAYNHFMPFYKNKLDLRTFKDHFMSGKIQYGPFWKHAWSYHDQINKANIILVKYEHLIDNIRGVIERLTKFLSVIEPTEEKLQKLIDHTSFSSMKNNKMVNSEEEIRSFREMKLVDDKYTLIRSGIKGGYKECFSEEDLEALQTWINESLGSKELLNEQSPIAFDI